MMNLLCFQTGLRNPARFPGQSRACICKHVLVENDSVMTSGSAKDSRERFLPTRAVLSTCRQLYSVYTENSCFSTLTILFLPLPSWNCEGQKHQDCVLSRLRHDGLSDATTFRNFEKDFPYLEEFYFAAYLKDGNTERQRRDPYPPFLDAIKPTLGRHQRLKQLVQSNILDKPLIVLSWS